MGWDITPVSEVMGCTLGEPQIDLQYFIKEHPLSESLDGLAYPENFFEKGRFPAYKRQFEILKSAVGDEMASFRRKRRGLDLRLQSGRHRAVPEVDLQGAPKGPAGDRRDQGGPDRRDQLGL